MNRAPFVITLFLYALAMCWEIYRIIIGQNVLLASILLSVYIVIGIIAIVLYKTFNKP